MLRTRSFDYDLLKWSYIFLGINISRIKSTKTLKFSLWRVKVMANIYSKFGVFSIVYSLYIKVCKKKDRFIKRGIYLDLNIYI